MKKLLKKFKDISFDLLLLFMISSCFFLGILLKINVLGLRYMIPIGLGLVLLNGFYVLIYRSRKLKKKLRIFFLVLFTLISVAFIIAGFVLFNVFSSVQSMFSNHSMIQYSVYVEKDQSYRKISDIEDKIVGYYTEDKYSEASKNELNKKVSVEFVGYSTLEDLEEALLSNEIDALLLMDSYLDVLERSSDGEEEPQPLDEEETFQEQTRVIYTFKIAVDRSDSTKKIDIENGTFAIFISGQDSYAETVSDTSRSDVNLLAIVNLKSKQILLISLPRDYYITIHEKGVYDKLTHISLYGSEVAANSIGDLLDVDVDTFIKFNFTTFMKAIEYILPLDVYSDYDFTTSVYDQKIGNLYTFQKGYNHITTGEMALQFVRARKNFQEGDRQRGINQTRMLRAIINKASTPAILLKYNDILKSLDGTFLTNLSDDSIIEIIKYLINHNSKFDISSYSLDGSDATRTCYSSGSTPLYVMIPNSKSVEQAKEYIQVVLQGEKPDIEVDASVLADVEDTHEVTQSTYKPTYSYGKTSTPSSLKEKEEAPSIEETLSEEEEEEENLTIVDPPMEEEEKEEEKPNEEDSTTGEENSPSVPDE